jgi:hypothetical protein
MKKIEGKYHMIKLGDLMTKDATLSAMSSVVNCVLSIDIYDKWIAQRLLVCKILLLHNKSNICRYKQGKKADKGQVR